MGVFRVRFKRTIADRQTLTFHHLPVNVLFIIPVPYFVWFGR